MLAIIKTGGKQYLVEPGTKINIEKYWDQKVEAMKAHKSQIKDVNFILSRYRRLPKVDSFILQYHRGVKVKFPETDLFAGL